MEVSSKMLLLLILLAMTLNSTNAKFMSTVAWFGRPEFASYDQIEVSHNSIKIAWVPPKNSGFPYNSQVEYCERDDSAVLASELVFYPMNMNYSYFNYTLAQDNYWENCKTLVLATQLQATFSSLYSNKSYRFKVKMTSNSTAGDTAYTDYKIITTKLDPDYEDHEYVHLYARGTGAKNQNSSVVMVDSNIILNNTMFRGLYLTVLSRYTLAKIYSAYYDTQMNQTSYTVNSDSSISYTEFTVADDLTYTEATTTSYTYSNPNEFPIAHTLAKKIREYDNKYIIILVSNNAWELRFTKELGDTLLTCGALNIVEFSNHYSPRFGQKTLPLDLDDTDPLTHTNFHHPYAFVGIPGLSPGQGYEQLRSNQGFHMSIGTYPYAEIRLRLRFNRMVGLYTFDTHQYMPQFHFRDPYVNVNQAKDRSLYSSFPSLMATNMTAYNDWKTSIFLPDDKTVFYTNATTLYQTKADTVYLQTDEHPYKYNYYNVLNTGTNLVWVHKKEYYSFITNFLYNDTDRECPPSYTDYTNLNCFNYTIVEGDRPEIFKCYTGLLPYYCPDNTVAVENSFSGYMQ